MLKTAMPKLRSPTLFRSAPVGNVLSRAELVSGLRRAWQQSQLDAIGEVERDGIAFTVASVLFDVASQFRLSHGEIVEILGERMFGEIERRTH